MKIISLVGPENSGKTTTLNMVYAFLSSYGTIEKCNERKVLGDDFKDFSCVIKYKKKKIALFSMGDEKGKFSSAINEYGNCDVFVCAVRNVAPKNVYDKFKDQLTQDGNITLEKTEDTNSQMLANLYDAYMIIQMIDMVVKNI